jgi:hypothetical protein
MRCGCRGAPQCAQFVRPGLTELPVRAPLLTARCASVVAWEPPSSTILLRTGARAWPLFSPGADCTPRATLASTPLGAQARGKSSRAMGRDRYSSRQHLANASRRSSPAIVEHTCESSRLERFLPSATWNRSLRVHLRAALPARGRTLAGSARIRGGPVMPPVPHRHPSPDFSTVNDRELVRAIRVARVRVGCRDPRPRPGQRTDGSWTDRERIRSYAHGTASGRPRRTQRKLAYRFGSVHPDRSMLLGTWRKRARGTAGSRPDSVGRRDAAAPLHRGERPAEAHAGQGLGCPRYRGSLRPEWCEAHAQCA